MRTTSSTFGAWKSQFVVTLNKQPGHPGCNTVHTLNGPDISLLSSNVLSLIQYSSYRSLLREERTPGIPNFKPEFCGFDQIPTHSSPSFSKIGQAGPKFLLIFRRRSATETDRWMLQISHVHDWRTILRRQNNADPALVLTIAVNRLLLISLGGGYKMTGRGRKPVTCSI